MVKIKIVGEYGKDKFILINPDCIVSVEKFGSQYNLYLSDGRVHQMTEDMYDENFAEDNSEEDEDKFDIGLTI